ncbi:MAG: hypothetical protein WAT39_22150 [Planctomycetota bacterium]
MTDPAPNDLASLEPLEPLDAGAMPGGPGPGGDDPMLQLMRSGMPAPAFNPYCRDKTFYRFLFAGVILIVATLLPFSAEPRAGYQTMSGALYLLLGIAMVWTWWGAIANNRSTNASLKWLLLCALPLIGGIWNLLAFDAEAALAAAKANRWVAESATTSLSLKELLGDMFGGIARRNVDALAKAETFWRLFGPGQFFILLGGLIAELGFLGGIVGGAKQNSADKKAKQLAAAERRRK